MLFGKTLDSDQDACTIEHDWCNEGVRSLAINHPSARANERRLREVIDSMFAFIGVLSPDGRIVIDFMLQPVFAEGRLRFVIPSGVDDTARHQAEQCLREEDRRKDVFLAPLLHELRTPLALIRTAAGLLASPKLGKEQLRWVRRRSSSARTSTWQSAR